MCFQAQFSVKFALCRLCFHVYIASRFGESVKRSDRIATLFSPFSPTINHVSMQTLPTEKAGRRLTTHFIE